MVWESFLPLWECIWESKISRLRIVWEWECIFLRKGFSKFFWEIYFVNLSIHNRFWIRVVSCYAWRTLLYAQAGPTWRDLYRISNSKECADALKLTPGHYSPDGYGSAAQARTGNLRGVSYKSIGSPPYYSYWSGAPPQWGAVIFLWI